MDEDPPNGPVTCPRKNNGAVGAAEEGIGAAGVSTTGATATTGTTATSITGSEEEEAVEDWSTRDGDPPIGPVAWPNPEKPGVPVVTLDPAAGSSMVAVGDGSPGLYPPRECFRTVDGCREKNGEVCIM
jgi:hypothetical protein